MKTTLVPDQTTLVPNQTTLVPDRTRRRFLRNATLAVGGGTLLTPVFALGARHAPAMQRDAALDPALRLHHLHTRETLELAQDKAAMQRPGFLATLNRFLRDHYSGVQGSMDPGLFVQVRGLQKLLESNGTVEVISGFRSAATNERLRQRGGGGVASRSLHLEGRALDLRISGVPLPALRDAALALRAGGVGFYPESDFVHIDTGRVRRWG